MLKTAERCEMNVEVALHSNINLSAYWVVNTFLDESKLA